MRHFSKKKSILSVKLSLLSLVCSSFYSYSEVKDKRAVVTSPYVLSESESESVSLVTDDINKSTNVKKITYKVNEESIDGTIASTVSTIGSSLSSNNKKASLISTVSNNITTKTSDYVSSWFNGNGQSKFDFELDNNDFSVKNVEFALLFPLYESSKDLFFVQEVFHRNDDRSQNNLGFGYRSFSATDYVWGANAFLDYDISHKNNRLGFGLEYWRDFLKLDANAYLGMSDWKSSPNVNDYLERAASGFDVSAASWLTFLPQLGGKLTFEQYFGDDVALFGYEKERAKDPYALVATVNYTPFPLLTFDASYKEGKHRTNEILYNMNLTYSIGKSLDKQLNPNSVAAMRSLVGQRYDFVNRNNNIVLQYKRKELINMKMNSAVSGFSAASVDLNVTVNSKYPLADIIWTGAEFFSAGGQVSRSGSTYNAKLPDYNTSGTSNTYFLTGVALDSKGNKSTPSSVMLSVLNSVGKDYTSFNAASYRQIANNSFSNSPEVIFTLRDESNNIYLGDPNIVFSLYDSSGNVVNSNTASLSSVVKNLADGTYTTSIKGSVSGTYTIKAIYSGTELASASVVLYTYGISSESDLFYTDVGGKVSPKVYFSSSDGTDKVDISSKVVWTPTNAYVSVNNDVITGTAYGLETLIGKVNYDGIDTSLKIKVSVAKLTLSAWTNGGDLNETSVISSYDNNTLYVKCNSTMIGGVSSTSTSSGFSMAPSFNTSGEKVITVKNINKVTKVQTVHNYINSSWLSQDIIFTYQDGTTTRCNSVADSDLAGYVVTFAIDKNQYLAGVGLRSSDANKGGWSSLAYYTRQLPN